MNNYIKLEKRIRRLEAAFDRATGVTRSLGKANLQLENNDLKSAVNFVEKCISGYDIDVIDSEEKPDEFVVWCSLNYYDSDDVELVFQINKDEFGTCKVYRTYDDKSQYVCMGTATFDEINYIPGDEYIHDKLKKFL